LKLGGVVLAGGRSSRMGSDKAWLDWHGVPLVAHVAEAVARAVGGRVVVVGAPGRPLPAGLDVIADPEPHRGPLAGVITGLATLGEERAFVCGCDQPDAHLLLGELLAARAADVVAFAGEPLGALYATRLARTTEQRDGSLKGFLETVDTEWLDGRRAELRSLNRPSDLQ
jgi:molybdenum cofactor guanylyltransferase